MREKGDAVCSAMSDIIIQAEMIDSSLTAYISKTDMNVFNKVN